VNHVFHTQRGQALAEAVVIIGVLAGLMWAVRATGAWQDQALRTAMTARQAAFAYTRFAPDPGRDAETSVSIGHAATLSSGAQTGGTHRHAAVLRREWALGDADVTTARAVAPMSHARQASGSLVLARHTAVLRGAGHAAGDAQTQQRVEGSMLGWQETAGKSISAGQRVAARMNPVDGAWGRAQPIFDWLTEWTATVPPQFLRAGGRWPWK